MNTTPDLTNEEIDRICEGLTQNYAKCRYLRSLGLRVERRPNGRPLVARAEWERRLVANSQSTAPTQPGANAPKWRVAA